MAEQPRPRGNSPAKSSENVKVRSYSFLRKNAWRIPSTLQNRTVGRNRHRSPLDDLRNLEKVCRFNNCSDCTPVSWTRQAPARYKLRFRHWGGKTLATAVLARFFLRRINVQS